MTSPQETPDRPRRGLAEKRQAIVRAARTVFGRDGYTRASIDAIAAEAGVSTRTIYNHFAGKELLFRTVVRESSAQVGEAQLDIIDRRLGKVTDLEADLTAFALAWLTPLAEFADHFGLVRQINAEARHLPKSALDAWQEAGPRRVLAALGQRFGELAGQGWLETPDPGRAAAHFVLLTTTEVAQRSYFGAYPLARAETEEIVVAGVRAFLRAYAAPRR
ncbi:TetR/AcrR family transcriptional regulator [Streptomyces sp. CB01881]|uniref:TetR/AcrR family transcriptional regulator n=1 Tax=Streptomyces sp. CB01881 TaxID=2078691 RepID=UPI000CDBE281|nr:TetR/AcrR family transcriptional regulator [Streptomyces sp. CB01881]AUY50097.1 TetR family transcriptional regulator [Streptomyces sp. CB01881]TYC73493.1 TetR/AcrR family transcriptional regulator [Streptomyces sp. CB01881]